MGLEGKLGLAGWQWLFLLEGLPAALFSFVILRMLARRPGRCRMAHGGGKIWLQRQLDADSAQAHLGHEAGVCRRCFRPKFG